MISQRKFRRFLIRPRTLVLVDAKAREEALELERVTSRKRKGAVPRAAPSMQTQADALGVSTATQKAEAEE